MPTSDWRRRAACLGLPVEFFFPPDGCHISKETRAVCAACPVRVACLNDALAVAPEDDWGFQGGTDAKQRRRLRHQRARGTAPRHLTLVS